MRAYHKESVNNVTPYTKDFLTYNYGTVIPGIYSINCPEPILEREAKYWSLRKWRSIKRFGFKRDIFPELHKYIFDCPYCAIYNNSHKFCNDNCPIKINGVSCGMSNHPYLLAKKMPPKSKEFRSCCNEIINIIKKIPVPLEPSYYV